jgi:uncharacterized protein (TIGR03435 family)
MLTQARMFVPLFAGLIISNSGADAQTVGSQQKVEFEAAAVKLSQPGFVSTTFQGGPGTSDPGRISYGSISLKNLLGQAYGSRYDAIVGPGWLGDVWVDVVATLPPGTTKEQLRSMLVRLLEERFKLVAHLETRETEGYALVVAQGGPILTSAGQKSVSEDSSPAPINIPGEPTKVDDEGFPLTPEGPGVHQVCLVGACRFRATRATMEELVDKLPCRCAIVNETHLTEKYAFTLTADVSPLTQSPRAEELAKLPADIQRVIEPGRGRPIPDIFRALQVQVGLKLVRKKVPGTFVVIDHIEKAPTEN